MTGVNRFWRSYFGQRVIIGIAVVMAAPVMIWAITAFMRTYIAPPKVAAYRPAALETPSPTAPEPMPTALSVRSVGSIAVASAGAPISIDPARFETAAKDVRLEPVPLPPRKPRTLSAAAQEPVPMPRPRPR